MTQMSADSTKDPLTHAIIGAAMEVHSQLGLGFLEPVYQEALAEELALRGIPFAREVQVPVHYKGKLLACTYRADFICYDHIIVELKALQELSGKEESQIINYLKAARHELGLVLNFGQQRLQFKRYIFTPSHLRSSAPSADHGY